MLTLSSNKTELRLRQHVPLVLCLVKCSVKLWRGPLFLARFVFKRLRFGEFLGVSRGPGEPNGRHDATRSHLPDPREDHSSPD